MSGFHSLHTLLPLYVTWTELFVLVEVAICQLAKTAHAIPFGGMLISFINYQESSGNAGNNSWRSNPSLHGNVLISEM